MDIICVCGSVRFKDEMLKFRDEQNAKGHWVLLPENMELDVQKIDTRVKKVMDSLHRAKIDHADSVLIWNKDGYIGESTRNELNYALSLPKPVRFLDDQVSCEKTIRKMVKEHNAEIHDKNTWWAGALNAYLEICGLSWDFVEEIEREAGF